jgi:hypothetical protein
MPEFCRHKTKYFYEWREDFHKYYKHPDHQDCIADTKHFKSHKIIKKYICMSSVF